MQFLQLKSKIYWTVIEIYLQDDSGNKQGPFAIDDPKLVELIDSNSQVFPTHEGRWMKANEVEVLKWLFSGEDDQNPEFVNRKKKESLTSIDGKNPKIKESTSSESFEASSFEDSDDDSFNQPNDDFDPSNASVKLNSWQYFQRCLDKDKYATFSGRARRSEYWSFVLWTFLLSILVLLIDILLFESSDYLTPLSNLFSLLVFIPQYAVLARRLHDIGRSAWWFLVVFTGIGVLVLLFWLFQESESGENKWGPNPKQID